MDALIIAYIFVIGACVGSFLNVVIYRTPRGESVAFPPSHCPKCGRGIAWYDNLPILSWLILGGKCRHCKVKISPQYICIEAATGLLMVGLYLCYFKLKVRDLGVGPGDFVPDAALQFGNAWPMFIAHGALICGLLASAAVDIKHYIIPLPVMWTVAIVGAIAAGFRPHPFLPSASSTAVAMSLAGGLGILLSLLAVHKGWLTPSFIDADEPVIEEEPKPKPKPKKKKSKRGSVGVTSADGVNPRFEMLREILFLLPAFALAVGAWALLKYSPAAGQWWGQWFDAEAYPMLAPRLAGVGGSLFGFLIGGLWIWGTRILATLAFGREAMGMGDVHILAGVGAVTGWAIPGFVFFVAPVLGVLWVLYLLFARGQRELPYGPYLAVGTVLVMVYYDRLVEYVGPGLRALFG